MEYRMVKLEAQSWGDLEPDEHQSNDEPTRTRTHMHTLDLPSSSSSVSQITVEY